MDERNYRIDFSACAAAGRDALRSRIEEARSYYSPMSSEYFDGILAKEGNRLSESSCGFLLLDGLLQKNRIDRSGLVISRNGDGRPSVINRRDIDFSISHSEGAVCCALILGEDARIGCDIQRARKYSPEKMSELAEIFMCAKDYMDFLKTNDERLFYTIWSRREAYIKANGGDVFGNLRDISFWSGNFSTKVISLFGERYYYSICT